MVRVGALRLIHRLSSPTCCTSVEAGVTLLGPPTCAAIITISDGGGKGRGWAKIEDVVNDMSIFLPGHVTVTVVPQCDHGLTT